jgi:hypothetical protein
MGRIVRGLTFVALLPVVAALAMAEETPGRSSGENPRAESAARDDIRRALETPGDFEFVETPLEEVVEFLRQRHGINIVFDKLALDDAGTGVDTPVTRSLSGVSLRSALNLMLRDIQLTFDLRDEALVITTPEELENRLDTVVYNVAHLTREKNEFGEAVYDADTLIDLIVENIYRESWTDVGGPGSIRDLHGRSLLVSQTYDAQDKIAQLFVTIRKVQDLQAQATDVETYYLLRHAGSNDAEILRALEQPARLEFLDAPLSEVVEFLSQTYGIEVQFDHIALDDAGIGTDTPVTARLSNMSLRSALNFVLRNLQLTYVILDEVLLITTPEEQENRLEVGVYPVGDLLRAPGAGADTEADYDSLRDIIILNVAPETWRDVGGPGQVRELPVIQSVVLSQTADVHKQIARLLTDLRKSRRAQQADAADPFGDGENASDDPFSDAAAGGDDGEKLTLKFYRLIPADGDEQGQEVIRLIAAVVEPESWGSRDGAMLMHVRGALAIRQSAHAHRKIQRLLTDLGAWSPVQDAIGGGFGGGFGGSDGGGENQGGGFFRVAPPK